MLRERLNAVIKMRVYLWLVGCGGNDGDDTD